MSPTEENFRSKTNAELKEILEELELSTPKAKNQFKPNKDEMVQALMQYKRAQDKLNGKDPEEGDDYVEEDEEETSSPTTVTRAQSKAEKLALLKADLMRMERVIVHDTQTSQTPVKAATVTWGNRLIGIQNDVVHFGTPWYVRRGALENLRSAVITEYNQEEGGPMRTDTRNRYQITDVGGWTDEELAIRANDQKIRNARTY